MSEIRTHPDGSTTIGPVDRYQHLIDLLSEYADVIDGKHEARRLAWFLGDRGEVEAAKAVMKHASVVEPVYYGTPMWGYFPTGGVP